jgi:hypothetical protein
MTREELYQGWIRKIRELSKLCPTLRRWLGGLGKSSPFWNMLNWKVNMGFRMNAYAVPEKSMSEIPV